MILAFGEFELDADQLELRRGGALVPVQRKPLELLVHLIRERHRVVEHEELRALLWPGTSVSRDAVFQAVRKARRALADESREPQILRTVRGTGLRFLPDVVVRMGRSEGSRAVFPSRHPALRALAAALDLALAGQAQIFALAGSAGIGKSVLVAELARMARERGAAVHVGASLPGEGLPALVAWIEILDQLVAARGRDAVRRLVGASRLPLANLLPDLAEPSHAVAGAGARRDPRDEFATCHAVARLLIRAAREHPLVLVLEDLQWAHPTSLLLLSTLLAEMGEVPLLVLATYRHDETSDNARLRELLEELPRHASHAIRPLGPLAEDEALAMARARLPFEPTDWLLGEIHRRSDANPRLIELLCSALASRPSRRDAVDGAPATRGEPEPTQREWAAALDVPGPTLEQLFVLRLERLATGTRDVLALAALAGDEFDFALLERASGLPHDRLVEALDEAVGAALLTEVRERPGHYRFSPPIVQQVLVSRQSAARRSRGHQALGDAIEALPGGAARLPELARHFFEAIGVDDEQRAFRYAFRAARLAVGRRDWATAAAEYERALAILDRVGAGDARGRTAVLRELAAVQLAGGAADALLATGERLSALRAGGGETS